jgi:hypothetical protein
MAVAVKFFSRNNISFLKMCAGDRRDRTLNAFLRADIMRNLQQAKEEETNVKNSCSLNQMKVSP